MINSHALLPTELWWIGKHLYQGDRTQMARSYITVVIAEPIVAIVLPQCTIATSQIVATIDVYVTADVPATGHAIDLISTCGLGCVPGGLRSVDIS